MCHHPENIEFEINREKLTRYWRIHGLIWTAGVFCFFSTLFSVTAGLEAADDESFLTPILVLRVIGLKMVTGMAWGLAAAAAVYLPLLHFQSQWRAHALSLSVEGAYLRFRSGWLIRRDQRIHFRAVSDYCTVSGPLMRCLGVEELAFRAPLAFIAVPAVQDAAAVRDALCEIDAAREGR